MPSAPQNMNRYNRERAKHNFLLTSKLITHAHIVFILSSVTIFAAHTDAIAPFKGAGWTTTFTGWKRVKMTTGSPAKKSHSIVKFPRGGDVNVGADHGDNISDMTRGKNTKKLVIVIDVDNTLYSEKDLLSNTGDGIESQIVRNTYLFGLLHFNLTSDQCDELYRTHGSTIEGLRNTLPLDQIEETMTAFYREVYGPIDYSCLLGMSKEVGPAPDDDKVISGYDHGHALQKRHALADFLKSICNIHSVYLASNSPKAHVIRVINSMGLGSVDFAGILSPDVDHIASEETPSDNHRDIYPTKSLPRQYFKHLLDRHPVSSNRIVLLDDSLYNIREAESVGIEGIHTNQPGRTLEEGIADALGHILPSESSIAASDKKFTFSDVEYLRAKNKADKNAINPSVWKQLAQQLALRVKQRAGGTLRVADLGAGLLSMLQLLIAGGGAGDHRKTSMLALINNIPESCQDKEDAGHPIVKLEYFAYEPNSNLLQGCKESLVMMGFQEINDDSTEDGVSFTRIITEPTNDIEVIVHLRQADFQRDSRPPKGLDLIIGCCFADLFDPDQLVLSLQQFAHHDEKPPLIYFPITFAGITQFDRTFPPLTSQSSTIQMVPSDTTAFRMYSESLIDSGHNLDPSLIVNAITDHGGSLISEGASEWVIDPSIDEHLWETMIYFFGMTGAREMAKHLLDAAGWIRRCRSNPRTILVSNVDLLLHLRTDSCIDEVSNKSHIKGCRKTVLAREIQFLAPYNVTSVTKKWDVSDSRHLSPDQVEIESLCSLISSGTELKIFKGSFESAALDVNIKGMADESMEYPLAYGYSLVGKVVACGANVHDADSLIGRLVFAFCPHSSRVIVDRDAVQLVPVGISAEDAIFFPSVETALSLVHDAHIRLGENVAVYGQGLIGLLVTSILSMQSSPLHSSSKCFSSVTVFDTLDDRLILSSSLGATSALKPDAAELAGPFDVSIEVSGNPRGLQAAIDHTSNNGRVIVGSWYGNQDVALKLGIDFHRSHKTVQTSQVSTIPPTLTGLWSKERRFLLTWALLKSICPSRLITKRVPLNEAQQAYELLDGGKEIAICFKYDERY